MHPAFSVLFFTVTSGFGYGFLFCLLLAQACGWISLSQDDLLLNAGIATALFTLGLLSSTQHLANPKNAWRSFTRFRTSWLSREGVLAVLGYPLFAITLYAMTVEFPSTVTNALVATSLLWTAALVYCTAMIYASLKTIPQWNTPWVPAAFIAFALSSGMLCLGVATHWQFTPLKLATAVVLATGLLIKFAYFRHVGKPTRSSINTATSFSQAKVTLFDTGHSSKNFLQKEFVYEVGPKTTKLARRVALVCAFILPAALVTFMPSVIGSWLALILAYGGLLLERWLLFVEAKHVVRHFYGE